jgi:hypothetical protein
MGKRLPMICAQKKILWVGGQLKRLFFEIKKLFIHMCLLLNLFEPKADQLLLLVPEYVKALLIILINEPLSIPISLPQLHCILCSMAVKVNFLVILAL